MLQWSQFQSEQSRLTTGFDAQIGTNQKNQSKMAHKVILIVGFIICEVLMLGVGTAMAAAVGFSIFSVGALYFGVKQTFK